MSDIVFAEPNEVAWRGVRPGLSGIQVHGSGNYGGTGNLSLYTVPTGRVCLITHIFLQVYLETGGGTGKLVIFNAVPAETITLLRGTVTNDGKNCWTASSLYFPIELTEDESVRLVNNNGGPMVLGGFVGIEIAE